MRLVEMTDAERRALEEAQRATRRVREWRRLQAVRLLADGCEAPAVAQALGCSASSVYYWATDWREAGLAGLAEGPHAGGRPRQLDQAAEATLEQVLGDGGRPPGTRHCRHGLDRAVAAYGIGPARPGPERADAAAHVASAWVALEAAQIGARTA